MFIEGSSFWVNAHNHLYFIISDPGQDPENIVHVNITSLSGSALPSDPYNDPACILSPGEHPRITRPTCIYYEGTQIASTWFLQGKLNRREIRMDDPASPAMLEKMRKGALVTEHILPLAADILIEQGLV